jgi:ABC-2 type transport system ATP-binding protein
LLARVVGVRRKDVHMDPAMGTINLPVSGGAQTLVESVRALDDAGIAIADITLRRPSLDDVFLALTGHGTDDEPDVPPSARSFRTRIRGRGTE